MPAGQFATILQEIGKELNLNLVPDQNNSSVIVLPTGIKIQMEIDDNKEFYVLCADIGQIPVGKYREDLFLEALQFNATPEPRVGTFAYCSAPEVLLLFKMIPLQGLDSKTVAESLLRLGKKASDWKSAINKGEHPEENKPEEENGSGLANLFGLKP